MSYIPAPTQPYTTYTQSNSYHNTLKNYIPNYQPKSDYLPGIVHEGSTSITNNYLRQYEEQKRRGRVITQKPAQFNPRRYVSYVTNEQVFTDKPLSQDHFSKTYVRR